jgi:hypothetical protein
MERSLSKGDRAEGALFTSLLVGPQYLFDLLPQRRDLILDHIPYKIVIDAEMNYPAASHGVSKAKRYKNVSKQASGY